MYLKSLITPINRSLSFISCSSRWPHMFNCHKITSVLWHHKGVTLGTAWKRVRRIALSVLQVSLTGERHGTLLWDIGKMNWAWHWECVLYVTNGEICPRLYSTTNIMWREGGMNTDNLQMFTHVIKGSKSFFFLSLTQIWQNVYLKVQHFKFGLTYDSYIGKKLNILPINVLVKMYTDTRIKVIWFSTP